MKIRWTGDDGVGLSVNLTFSVSPKEITVTIKGGESVYGQNPSNNPVLSATGLVYGETVAVLVGLFYSFLVDKTTMPGT
jgi:hypothetical protein